MGESHAFARMIDMGGVAPETKKSQEGQQATEPAPITQDVQTQEET
jgi:hypothetical protein